MLADLAVTGEPELLVGRQGAVEEEAGGHRAGGFRVSLDTPPAQARDEIERAGQRRSGHTLPPVPLTDIAARDPPVRRGRPALFVRRPALDPRHLVGRAELAPADAVLPFEDKRSVGPALADPLFLRGTFLRYAFLPHGGPRLIGVEPHAPAAAENTVVPLHQRGERGPGRLIERLHGVPRLGHEVQPNAGHDIGPSLRTTVGAGPGAGSAQLVTLRVATPTRSVSAPMHPVPY